VAFQARFRNNILEFIKKENDFPEKVKYILQQDRLPAPGIRVAREGEPLTAMGEGRKR
jgi:hypothetical protein